MLNIVLVRAASKVEGLKSLVDFVHVTKKSGRFKVKEPHVFLLAEDHFQTQPPFKTRQIENMPSVLELVKALKGTNWRFAFSVNESVGNRVSNTGYFVSPDGFSAMPKRSFPNSDEGNVSYHANERELDESDLSRWWKETSDILRLKDFQQQEIDGHAVEFRVCADARVEKPANQNCLTLVSAEGLGKMKEHAQREIRARLLPFKLGNEIDDGIDVGNLSKTRGAVVINDSRDGLNLLFGEKKFDLLEQLNEANEALKPKGIQLHRQYF